MSEPWSAAPVAPQETATAPATPASLLEQMQALLSAISTDLAGLDADLQSSAVRSPREPGTPARG